MKLRSPRPLSKSTSELRSSKTTSRKLTFMMEKLLTVQQQHQSGLLVSVFCSVAALEELEPSFLQVVLLPLRSVVHMLLVKLLSKPVVLPLVGLRRNSIKLNQSSKHLNRALTNLRLDAK